MPVQFNNALAEWAQRLIGDRSLRQVEVKTRIPFTTIANLKQGRVPSADTIIRFAAAFNQDVPAALRLAGYDDLAEMWETGAAPTQESREPIQDEPEPYFGFHEDLRDWARLTDEERDDLRRIIRRYLRESRDEASR